MQEQSTRVTKRGAPTIPRECRQCGAPFLTWRYKVEQGTGNYCSSACFLSRPRENKGQRRLVSMSCESCGSTFEVWPYRLKGGHVRFCSFACAYAGKNRGSMQTCVVCWQDFYVTAARRRLGPVKHCSITCRGITVRAMDYPARTRDSAKNRKWREAVYEKDGYTCQGCGEQAKEDGDTLHAHHVQTWDDAPDLRFEVANGMTLCKRCHGRLHAGGKKVGT